MVLCALVITGFLLGGYAGAVIVPAATCLFLVSNADLPTLAEGGDTLGRLWWPRVLAGLLIAASVCGAAGEHLQQAGTRGLAVTALLDTGFPRSSAWSSWGAWPPPSSLRYLAGTDPRGRRH